MNFNLSREDVAKLVRAADALDREANRRKGSTQSRDLQFARRSLFDVLATLKQQAEAAKAEQQV